MEKISWRGWEYNVRMRTSLFWAITQRVVVIYYRRFGTTYRYHPQGSRIQNIQKFLNPEDGTYNLSRNVRKILPPLAA